MEKLLTVSEVAEILRLNRFTIYRMSERGRLPSVKIGKALRFRQSDLDAWLERVNRARKGK